MGIQHQTPSVGVNRKRQWCVEYCLKHGNKLGGFVAFLAWCSVWESIMLVVQCRSPGAGYLR